MQVLGRGQHSSASFRSPEVIRFSLIFTLVFISQSSVAHALTPYADFKERSAFDGISASNTISLSIDGDTIVSGAHGDASNKGAAYVFMRDIPGDLSSSWTQVAKLTASDGVGGAQFGHSVSIYSNTIVIGASRDDSKGAAYVFTRNTPTDLSSGWTYRTRLTANDGQVDDRFGSSVSIDGDTVAIGAWADDDNGPTTGSVYIFTRGASGDVTSSYTQLFKFSSNDIQNYDSFGEGVLIDKYTLVVGAFWNGGSLYMFSPDPCTASTDQSKDGSNGAFYCINGGTIGGITGSCTCTGCNTGYDGASCETAGPCSTSDDPDKDGSDGKFWCINGGIVGGTADSCTCTCQVGWEGLSCETPSVCTASAESTKDGSDGVLYCAELRIGAGGGTIGGTTNECTCTCAQGWVGSGCQTADACTESLDSSKDGSDGSIHCGEHGTVGGVTNSCTCTCDAGWDGSGCETAKACTASSLSTKDGTDGNFYCINGGTVGGTTGSCTCTSCNAGYGGASCETAGACSTSTDPSKDGADGSFYCINGGTVGGTAGSGSCTCTSCNTGYEGASCQTASACTASAVSTKDGSDGTFYCVNGGTVGGTTGSCTCTGCNAGYSGANCQVADACTASTTASKDGSDGTFYCINGGTVGGTTGSCTCTGCDARFEGSSCQTVIPPPPPSTNTTSPPPQPPPLNTTLVLDEDDHAAGLTSILVALVATIFNML